MSYSNFFSDYFTSGLLADRPANPVTDPGTNPEMPVFYFATDTNELWMFDGDGEVWIEISTGSGSYTDAEAQDAVGGIAGASLTYVANTSLVRAALTGDVTAPENSNSTTIAADAVTNAKLANMAAWTIKANNTSGSANPTDPALADLTEEAAPGAGDFLLGFLASGEIRIFDVDNLPASGSSAGWELLGTATPSGTTTVTFNPIAGGYSALRIVGMARSTTGGTGAEVLNIWLNNDTTTGNYRRQNTIGNGSTTAGENQQSINAPVEVPTDGNLADMPGYFDVIIPFYDKTVYNKCMLCHYNFFNSNAASGQFDIMNGMYWVNTAAITRVDLVLTGNFKAGSEIRLYGIP